MWLRVYFNLRVEIIFIGKRAIKCVIYGGIWKHVKVLTKNNHRPRNSFGCHAMKWDRLGLKRVRSIISRTSIAASCTYSLVTRCHFSFLRKTMNMLHSLTFYGIYSFNFHNTMSHYKEMTLCGSLLYVSSMYSSLFLLV